MLSLQLYELKQYKIANIMCLLKTENMYTIGIDAGNQFLLR